MKSPSAVEVGAAAGSELPALARGPFGLFTGWYNVVLALVMITFVVGSTNYSFGLYIKPAAEALSLSRASTNIGLVALMVGIAVFSPLMGRLLDRVPIIPVARSCAVMFGLTMFVISQSSSPLLLCFLLAVPLAIAAVGCGGLFGTVLVSRWFTDRRGRALSIMWMGTSFGGMLIVPLNAMLIEHLGWRSALGAMGLIVGTMVILLTFFVKPRPDDDTQVYLAKRNVGHTSGLSWREILGQRDFWIIVIPVSLMLSVDQTMLATITPYVLDRGMSLAQAASLMSAATASAIAGKIIIAWIADRADLRLLLAITAIFGVIQCGALIFDPSYPLLLAVCLLTGLAVGGTMPLASIVLAYRFGAPSIGTVMGLQMPVNLVLSMLTLYFVGAAYDRFGSYSLAFMAFAGMFAGAIFITPFIRYRPSSNDATVELKAEASA